MPPRKNRPFAIVLFVVAAVLVLSGLGLVVRALLPDQAGWTDVRIFIGLMGAVCLFLAYKCAIEGQRRF